MRDIKQSIQLSLREKIPLFERFKSQFNGRLVTLVSLGVLGISGCGAEKEKCYYDWDCAPNESCVSGKCTDSGNDSKNLAQQICLETDLCSPNIREMDYGSLYSPINPDSVGLDSNGNVISLSTVIVKFNTSERQQIEDLLLSSNAKINSYFSSIDYYVFEFLSHSASEVEEVIGILASNPMVATAGKNYAAELGLPLPSVGNAMCYPVEEMDYTEWPGPSIWGFEKVELSKAYGLLDEKEEITLEPVKVAVLDSGFELTHPELKYQFLEGHDFADGDDDVTNTDMDSETREWAHGTKVCGIIAAKSDGEMMNGVAYLAEIIPLKVFPSKKGILSELLNGPPSFESTVTSAIEYAIDAEVDVINMSFTTHKTKGWFSSESGLLETIVDAAHAKNIVLVAGAGNNDMDASDFYPAAYINVISVGATNQNDERANGWGKPNNGSNYSETDTESVLTVAAPGEGICIIR